MCQPYSIPEVAPEELSWRNELLACERDIRFAIGESTAQLQFSDDSGIDVGMFVQLRTGATSWSIGFSDWDAVAPIANFLEGAPVTSLPEDLVPAILEAAFEDLLNQLSQKTETPCKICTAKPGSETNESTSQVEFALEFEGQPTARGVVAGDQAAMQLLAQLVATAPAREPNQIDDIPIVAGIEIGLTQLTVDQVQNLKINDVVMMQITRFQENPVGIVRFPPNMPWRVTLEDETVTFNEAVEVPSPSSLEPDTAIVNVVFQKGTVQMLASQLATLEADSTVTAQRAETITLSSNGKPFAEGELVKIGDRLGTKLLILGSAQ